MAKSQAAPPYSSRIMVSPLPVKDGQPGWTKYNACNFAAGAMLAPRNGSRERGARTLLSR